MGKRKYIPLTPAEVEAVLRALQFTFKVQVGSHAQFERPADQTRKRAIVTVDRAKRDFGDDLMASMIRQSGFSRDEFYGATRKTARKASVRFFSPETQAMESEGD